MISSRVKERTVQNESDFLLKTTQIKLLAEYYEYIEWTWRISWHQMTKSEEKKQYKVQKTGSPNHY